ncbi:MAG TPA: FtsX-like permease family protein [Pyrinomonadaceae bacterium]|nr:FtsX-like permease family protein [Pyrinomonadaceae bacterium]
MRTRQLLKRNLVYYWRTNIAVILGVAAAVAVLSGALLVGDSVRGSLRDLFLQRLGRTEQVLTATGFFRERLSDEIDAVASIGRGFTHAAPLIEIEGSISNDANKTRAGGVRVYGIDDRFKDFHFRELRTPQNREVLISDSLAQELGARPGESILVQFEKPSDVPIESLYGQKDDLSRTLRLTITETLSPDQLGEFSTRPQQTSVRAVFVPLELLQRELDQPDKVNTILFARVKDSGGFSDEERTAAIEQVLREKVSFEDYNIKVRPLDQQRGISLERSSTLIDDALAKAARDVAKDVNLQTVPVLSYVANGINAGGRTIPYSLVTAIDDPTFESLKTNTIQDASGKTPIILNEWAARDLNAKLGDAVSLEYYVWHEDGKLETKQAEFQLAAVVPISGLAADRDLVPEYPGISESPSMSDWDPPFPVDLKRIRQQDEDYWDQYKTTPKAFLPLSAGQQLWQSRYGKLTSIRVMPGEVPVDQAALQFQEKLRSSLTAAAMGMSVLPVRAEGLAASQGATDFGEYFLYFSFFLVVSALMLAALFFKLGVEQRLREIGLLQAIGFPAKKIRTLFLIEGALLAVIGSLLGLAGAIGYAYLLMLGLRTWWVDAVGTTMLKLHVSPQSLFIGALGGTIAAIVCILWTLKRVGRASSRSLLAGTMETQTIAKARPARFYIAVALTVLGILLLVLAAFKVIGQLPGFFGGGTLLLVALLCFQSVWLRQTRRKPIEGNGLWPVLRLGFRNATYRPGRSVLCIALIASATFIIVAVDAFRRGEQVSRDNNSGSGGFELMAETVVPVVHNLNISEGREALNLTGTDALTNVNFVQLRLKPGDDASCLNLYQPRNPRVLGVSDEFVNSGRFAFHSSLANSGEENQNPWLLLNRELEPGVVPVIADANSINYVLHLKLGEELVLNTNAGSVRLRIVGALADSIFQSELVMSERNFLRLFPGEEGYRYFLVDAEQSEPVAQLLEDRLADFGFDAVTTGDRLANFHRVENTYLSTFQMLGALGLLLGTLGMAAVLLRNVLERRRELALLRAFGYNSSHFTLMVVAENAFLLLAGLVTGAVCALLAIAPVFIERGGRLPNISLGVLLLAVLISGLIASLLATWAALRSPLIPALRAE